MAYTTIDDPSAHFQSAIWSGTGSALSVTFGGNSDMQPDMVWVKNRTVSSDHRLSDSVRGTSSHLVPNDAAAIDTSSTALTAFNSDGFSVGTEQSYSQSGKNHVGWAWKAGTSFTNDASGTGIGTIDSTGSVNTDAGFSIVSYSGNSTAGATIAHGLGATPKMMIVRKRNSAENWLVYHASTGNTGATLLNGTNAFFQDNMWNSTSPTSSVFTVHGDDGANGSGGNYIAYCFSEKKGYSKFGSYTGNGNADGTFVYTGFKPAFFICKRYNDSGYDWLMYDNKRQVSFNVIDDFLKPNLSDVETTGNANQSLDFLSNGVKHRGNGASSNGDGVVYIYMAFAENPFTTSTGIPTTAR